MRAEIVGTENLKKVLARLDMLGVTVAEEVKDDAEAGASQHLLSESNIKTNEVVRDSLKENVTLPIEEKFEGNYRSICRGLNKDEIRSVGDAIEDE